VLFDEAMLSSLDVLLLSELIEKKLRAVEIVRREIVEERNLSCRYDLSVALGKKETHWPLGMSRY
jgi:hypothetical protein